MTPPAKPSPPAVEAALDFSSFLCSLFAGTPLPPDAALVLMGAVNAAVWARRAADAFPIGPLPDELRHRGRDTLFHERVHYWQRISAPLQQLEFTIFLDRVRAGVLAAGGNADEICGQTLLGPEPRPGELDAYWESVRSHFRPLDDGLFPPDTLPANEDFAAMRFVMLPHATPGHGLPGYVGMLPFADGSAAVFPFTASYLLEGAARNAEELFAGRPTPRLVAPLSTANVQYLGAWEFWRREHGERYDSESNLALAFLAAVDLAVCSDPFRTDVLTSDEYAELSSIPYRFGKLSHVALSLEPLIAGDDAAAAIDAFQRQACEALLWDAPDVAVRRAIVFLTRLLIAASARWMEPADEAPLRAFLEQDASSPPGDLRALEPVWAVLAKANTAGSRGVFGQAVLGVMLNAAVARVRRPGIFAAPHLYADELRAMFPLPLIVSEGDYFFDDGALGAVEPWPYPVTPTELVHDCVALVTIAPFADGSPSCGFLASGTPCWYVRAGLGCPAQPLTAKQRLVREQTELDDWCHWRLRTLVLHTAPSDVAARWQARFRATIAAEG